MVPSFLTVDRVAGCVCVVRMEGKGCGVPEGLDNSRGRRRPAAVLAVAFLWCRWGAPRATEHTVLSLPLEFKKYVNAD